MTTMPGPGDAFAGYRIDAPLGHGGMGMVLRATELAPPGRTVALKLILPERAADREFRDRFEREARLAQTIQHDHVIPVLDAGEHDGVAFMAMRLVEGIDLAAVLGMRAPLHPRHAAGVIAPIAFALGAAHELGLVHRDIKPANILLEPVGERDFHPWLTDFGLTKHRESTSGLTQQGQWVGTVDYAAPEQITGDAIDGPTDVYALGCLLYVCLSGKVPFPLDKDVSKIMAHISEPPPVTFGLYPNVPMEFDAVIHRAMEKDPGDRYPSAAEMGEAVLAAAEGCKTDPPGALLTRADIDGAQVAEVDRDAPTAI